MIDLVFDNFADEQFQLVYRSWLISEVPEGLKNYNVTNFKNQGESSMYIFSSKKRNCHWKQGNLFKLKDKKSVKFVGAR